MNENHIADERKKVLETPERIFLVVGDLSDLDDPALFRNLDGVSWCEDQIDDHDIEYVRADLAAPIAPRAAEQPKEYERYDPDNATAPFLSFIPDAKRDEMIGALLASLERSDQRETDFYMVLSFIGGLGLLAAQFAPRADADTAGASDDQLDKLFFWMCTNYKTEGLHGFKAKARDLFAAGASNERADAEKDAANVAKALEACDWSGVSIGNKAIIQRAIAILAAKEKK